MLSIMILCLSFSYKSVAQRQFFYLKMDSSYSFSFKKHNTYIFGNNYPQTYLESTSIIKSNTVPYQVKIITNYTPPKVIQYRLRPNRPLYMDAKTLDGGRPKAPYWMRESTYRYNFLDVRKPVQ
jgi:hypothetical protein